MSAKALFHFEITPMQAWVWGSGQAELLKRWQNHAKPGKYTMPEPKTFRTPKTKKQVGFYWVRMNYIVQATGELEAWLHEGFMQNCGFGVYKTMPGPINERGQKTTVNRFFRRSSDDLSIEEYAKLIDQQDRFAEFWNEGMPEDKRLQLPEARSVQT